MVLFLSNKKKQYKYKSLKKLSSPINDILEYASYSFFAFSIIIPAQKS